MALGKSQKQVAKWKRQAEAAERRVAVWQLWWDKVKSGLQRQRKGALISMLYRLGRNYTPNREEVFS